MPTTNQLVRKGRQSPQGNRCGLGAGQQALAKGILSTFADDVVACLEGRCPGHRGLLAPMPIDHDPSRGRTLARFVT